MFAWMEPQRASETETGVETTTETETQAGAQTGTQPQSHTHTHTRRERERAYPGGLDGQHRGGWGQRAQGPVQLELTHSCRNSRRRCEPCDWANHQ